MAILRFDNIVEEWATKYKPMRHDNSANSKNKRFFRLNAITSIADFVKSLTIVQSPAVGCVTHLDGDIRSGKFMYPIYRIYIFMNCPTGVNSDTLKEADTKAACLDHAMKFVAWILNEKQTAHRKELAQINTDEIDYQVIGPFFNNWYACELILKNMELVPRCINPDDYVE